MSPNDSVAQETKWLQMRSCKRVNARISVRMEWTDAGRQCQARGFTIDVSRQGCLLMAAQGFTLNQRIQLTNLANHQTVAATLIWKGDEGQPGWELGLELLDPPHDFWGLEI